MRQDRRRSKRFSVQQIVSITLGNGGGVVTAISDNVSTLGAFLYCDRFIAPGTTFFALPLQMTHGKAVPGWCSCKVLRIEKELSDGKFGTGVEFTMFPNYCPVLDHNTELQPSVRKP